MLKKGLLLQLLLVLLVFPVRSQSLCTVHRYPDSVLLKRKLLPGQFFSAKYTDHQIFHSDLYLWLDTLHDEGYLEARVDSVHTDSLSCLAWVFTGPRYTWGLIRSDSNRSEVIQRAGIRPGRMNGEPLRWASWIRLNERAIKYYENNGHPFARSGLTGLRFEGSSVSGVWELDPGPYFVYDSLIIKGNARVHPGVMRRQLDVNPGRAYQEKQILSIPEKIREMPYLREIRGAETEFFTGKTDVYVYIDKQPASRFNGVLGLLPGSRGTGRWLLTGDVDIDLRNALARGERMGVRWRRMDEASQELKLHAALPYLFFSPAGMRLHFDMVKRDTSYLNLMVHAGLTVRGKNGAQYQFYHRRSVSSGIAASSPFPGIRSALYGLGFARERLDHPLFPGRGWRIEAHGSAGNRKLEGSAAEDADGGSTLQLEGEWLAEGYIPVGRSFTAVFLHRGGYRNSFEDGSPVDRLFENEMFRLGGYGSIRGFDEDALAAERYAVFTAEWRYSFEERSWFHVFAEGGRLLRHTGEARRDDYPFGFGTGMNLNTGSGVISIAVALGSQQGNPLRLGETRMHIGFQGLF